MSTTNMKRYIAIILALASISSLLSMSGFAKTKTVIATVPFIIATAGTYVLAANLTLSGTGASAVTVNASNVAIDLSGFTLATSDQTASNTGITVSSTATNVTIANGKITGFGTGVLLQGANEVVENLSLSNPGQGIEADNPCTSSVIRGCFITGNGLNEGVFLNGCTDVMVKNNQFLNEAIGGFSGGNSSFIANYIGNCKIGLELSATDKYQANLTNTCATPFSGGIAVGNENN